MLSYEERKAIERLNIYKEKIKDELYPIIDFEEEKAIGVVLNLIKKQSKEIEELSDKLTQKICKGVEEEILEEYRQTIISKDKEIEELKEKCKSMIDPSKARLTYNKGGAMVVLEGFISKKESEQKEKEAWIKGTNEADELCNKKWKNKIKAKIEYKKDKLRQIQNSNDRYRIMCLQVEIEVLQSLLEKE